MSRAVKGLLLIAILLINMYVGVNSQPTIIYGANLVYKDTLHQQMFASSPYGKIDVYMYVYRETQQGSSKAWYFLLTETYVDPGSHAYGSGYRLDWVITTVFVQPGRSPHSQYIINYGPQQQISYCTWFGYPGSVWVDLWDGYGWMWYCYYSPSSTVKITDLSSPPSDITHKHDIDQGNDMSTKPYGPTPGLILETHNMYNSGKACFYTNVLVDARFVKRFLWWDYDPYETGWILRYFDGCYYP